MQKSRVALIIAAFFVVAAVALTKDEARKRLDQLLEDSQMHAQAGLSWLQKQVQLISDKASIVHQQGSKLITQESTRFTSQLNDLQKDAEKEGFNVTSCTKSKASLLTELTELARLELLSCVDRFAQLGVNSLNNALARFNRITRDVEELVPVLETCSNQTCIDKVAARIAFEEIDCPRRFQEETELAGNRAEASNILISDCGVRHGEQLVAQSSAVIQDLRVCIDKIIHG